jgi:hypothetical protein
MTDKEMIAAGVEWLSLVAEGEAPQVNLPGADVLEAFAVWAAAQAAGEAEDDAPLPEFVEVKLRQPLEKTASGGERLSVLRFKTPSLREITQMRAAGRSKDPDTRGVEIMVHGLIILNQHDLERADLERLSASDAGRCCKALAPFCG